MVDGCSREGLAIEVGDGSVDANSAGLSAHWRESSTGTESHRLPECDNDSEYINHRFKKWSQRPEAIKLH